MIQPIAIRVEGVARAFGAHVALGACSLEVAPGELVALLGASGSGKTTLLRLLAGLDFPDQGRILFGDQDVTEVHARERGAGIVFQHYALFEHMSALDNVAFGLDVQRRKRHLTRAAVLERAAALLERVGLGSLGQRKPHQLSGGQRQRVALARALAVEPRVLLLDEPFSALDTQVRAELGSWVRGLQQQLGITTLLVTHNPEEACRLSDRVAVLGQGRLLQLDTPRAIQDHPATPGVAALLGAA